MEHRDTESQSFIAEGEIVRELFRHYHSVIPQSRDLKTRSCRFSEMARLRSP